MSIIAAEIAAIEAEVNQCFASDAPIDTKKIKRLHALRMERVKELVSHHAALLSDRRDRFALMQAKTREWSDRLDQLTADQMKLNPAVVDKIHAESDKYDMAATHWVDHETTPWEESEAASIAVGILFLADEIC